MLRLIELGGAIIIGQDTKWVFLCSSLKYCHRIINIQLKGQPQPQLKKSNLSQQQILQMWNKSKSAEYTQQITQQLSEEKRS